MKLKFDFDYQRLQHLEGKKIVGVSFGIAADDLCQFVDIELDDGTELYISTPLKNSEEMEFELTPAGQGAG